MMRFAFPLVLLALLAIPLVGLAGPVVNLPADSYTPLPGGLGEYVRTFYTSALMFGGVLAFAVLMFAAAEYTISGGNPSKQSDARDRIEQALLGLLLLLGAFIVLNAINPELVDIRLDQLKRIKSENPAFLTQRAGAIGGPCRPPGSTPCDTGLTCSRSGFCGASMGTENGLCRTGSTPCNLGMICDSRGLCARPPDSAGVSSQCLVGPANAQYTQCFAGSGDCDGGGSCSTPGGGCQSFTNPNCQ